MRTPPPTLPSHLVPLFDFCCITEMMSKNRTFSSLLNLGPSDILEILSSSSADTDTTKENSPLRHQENQKGSFFYPKVDRNGNNRLVLRYQIPKSINDIDHPFREIISMNNKDLSNTKSTISKATENKNTFPLSAIFAVIDIVTTQITFLYGKHRPGVSVNLHVDSTNSFRGNSNFKGGDFIDVDVGVTKTGQTLGFTDAIIRPIENNVLTRKIRDDVCIITGRHIKFLPGGYLMEFALSNMRWTKYLLSLLYPKRTGEETAVADNDADTPILSLQDVNIDGTQAIFHVDSEYLLNEGGSLHGGCIAMLMERMGQEYLKKKEKREKDNDIQQIVKTHQLQSINISYLSSCGLHQTLQLSVEEIDSVDHESSSHTSTKKKSKNTITTKITLRTTKKKNRRVILSEGVLKWVVILEEEGGISKDRITSKL